MWGFIFVDGVDGVYRLIDVGGLPAVHFLKASSESNFIVVINKKETPKVKLPKGFTIKLGLEEKYADQPFFQEKVDRANYILKKFGLPKVKFG